MLLIVSFLVQSSFSAITLNHNRSSLNVILAYFETPGTHTYEFGPGRYKVELWGAQGGRGMMNGRLASNGGKGAYTSGMLNVEGTATYYFLVGGRGSNAIKGKVSPGGINGGGNGGRDSGWWVGSGDDGGAGGGATDMRMRSGDVSSRIMVAAGGSGGAYNRDGAYEGALSGTRMNGRYQYENSPYTNQVRGDVNGQGGEGKSSSFIAGSGGGGGYRGGRGGLESIKNTYQSVGDSGSSYISGYTGCSPHSSGIRFVDPYMSAGNKWGKTNNGLAKITLIFYCYRKCAACYTSENGGCTKCKTGFFLYRGYCGDDCPEGTYKDQTQRICFDCRDPHCKSCSDTSTKQCQECETSYLFYDNQCFSECPQGTYPNPERTRCLKCNETCKTQ